MLCPLASTKEIMRSLSYFQYCTLIHVKTTCVNEDVKFLCLCLKLHLPNVMILLSKYQVCGKSEKYPWQIERGRRGDLRERERKEKEFGLWQLFRQFLAFCGLTVTPRKRKMTSEEVYSLGTTPPLKESYSNIIHFKRDCILVPFFVKCSNPWKSTLLKENWSWIRGPQGRRPGLP